MQFFGYGEQDFIPAECGHNFVQDVHHLSGRGKGKDVIENLVGLCRECHTKAHSNKEFNEEIRIIHLENVKKGYVSI